jgi:hypothetical protein
MDFWELLKEPPKPRFDSLLPLESATRRNFTGIDKHAIIIPGGHESFQIALIQGIE